MRVALCFACDDNYAPLCKGLVLSLAETLRRAPADMEMSLHFVDIGCGPGFSGWLEEHGVARRRFSRADVPLLPRQDLLPGYADAQLCRPFLPEIAPGYDVYVWLDCDIWMQAHDAVPEAVRAAAGFKDKMVICPEYHYGYLGHRDFRMAVLAQRRWYAGLYKDEELVEDLSFKPMYNSGFFAMRGDSALWRAWAEELAGVYAGDHSADPSVLHYAEQLGLNRVLHQRRAQIPLDPSFNYACGGSVVFRNPRGKVVVGYPPCAPVKGVHLLAFPLYGSMYLEKGLLYEQGRYLAPEEKEALRSLLKR